MTRLGLVALCSLALFACSTAEPEEASQGVDVSNLTRVDLTRFVVDTPAEERLFATMESEMAAGSVDYSALEALVPTLLEGASSDVRDLHARGGLNSHEVVGIYFYTTAAYEWLNKPLRANDSAALAKWDATIKVASSGLNKLPGFSCSVKRGTGLPPEVLDQLVEGASFREKAFMSTTLGRIPKAFVKPVEFKINSDHCKAISWASQYPNEKEVLFPPGSEFGVVARRSCPLGVREHCIEMTAKEAANGTPLATGSEETEPSHGTMGVDVSYRESDFTGKRFMSVKDESKYVKFDTTRVGTWVNTNGENAIADWVLDHDSNIIEITYRRPGETEQTTGWFMVLSETKIGRLRGPNSDRVDEYYEVAR